jgi:hypothetical protein
MTYAFTDNAQIDELPRVDAMPVPGCRSKVTFEVDAADAWWVVNAMGDSATYWFNRWQQSPNDPNIDAQSCLNIRNRAWRLYRQLRDQADSQGAMR